MESPVKWPNPSCRVRVNVEYFGCTKTSGTASLGWDRKNNGRLNRRLLNLRTPLLSGTAFSYSRFLKSNSERIIRYLPNFLIALCVNIAQMKNTMMDTILLTMRTIGMKINVMATKQRRRRIVNVGSTFDTVSALSCLANLPQICTFWEKRFLSKIIDQEAIPIFDLGRSSTGTVIS